MMDIRLCLPCGYAAPPPAVECPHCGTALVVRDERWLIGQTLGNYRIERILGSGGMGVVFGARHEALLREAAIKVLQPGLGSGGDGADAEAFARRFLQEARLLAALDHPGIVGIYDFAVSPFGFPYLVMPLLRGETLRELLQRHPEGLPPAWVAAIVQDLCEALGHAHSQGVVHRDLKPENVFLGTEGGRAWTRLLDFGIAHSQRQDAMDRTMTGMLMGTPLYLSPEQLRGEAVSAATDQYSLALLVVEMLDGRAVRAGESLTAIMRRYAEAPLPAAALPPALPQAQALRRATDPQPAARYSDLIRFREALALPDPARGELAQALRESTPAAPAPAATAVLAAPAPVRAAHAPAVSRPAVRKSGWAWRWTAAGALAAVLMTGAWLLRKDEPAVTPSAASAPAMTAPQPSGWLRSVDATPLPGALEALAQSDQTLVLRQAGGWMLFDLDRLTAAPGAGLARGERLLGADGESRLWLLHDAQVDALDPASGRREAVAKADATLDAPEGAAWAMDEDGEWLARTEAAKVTIFRVSDGRAQRWMERATAPDTRVALGASSAALAGPRGRLQVLDLATRELRWERELPEFRVNALALDESLGRLALATENGISIHGLADGALESRLPETATGLVWFDDGPRLASIDGRGLRLWEWRGGEPVQSLLAEGGDWLFRGATHLIAGGDGVLRRYAFGEEFAPVDVGVGPVWAITTAGGYAYLGGSASMVARLAPGVAPLHRRLHDAGVPDLRVHDGRLISASDDRTLAAWRLPELETLWRVRGHDFLINQIALGASLWTASSDGSLRRWRWPELESVENIALRARVHPRLELHALWAAPDDSELLVGTWNHRVLRLVRAGDEWALGSAPFAAHVGYRMVDLPALEAVLVLGVRPGRLAIHDRRSGELADLPRIGHECHAAAGDDSGRGAWLGCRAALLHLRLARRQEGGFTLEAGFLESTALDHVGALAQLPHPDAATLVLGNEEGQAIFLPVPADLPLVPQGRSAAPRGFAALR